MISDGIASVVYSIKYSIYFLVIYSYGSCSCRNWL